MTNRLTTRDWETLSAYIDRQLSHKEEARLEARLAKEPELQAAMESLSRTRSLVRRLPALRAPRNFTLTPAMVGVRKPAASRSFPVLSFASAVASLLFVLVLVGDLLAPRYAAPVFEEASRMAVEESAGSDNTEKEASEFAMESAPLSEPYPAAEAGSAEAPETEEGPSIAMAAPPAAADAAMAPSLESAYAYAIPGGEAGLLMDGAEPAQTGDPYARNPVARLPQSTVTTLEVTLAAAALLTGLSAYYLRRRNS